MQVFDASSMIYAWDNYPEQQFPGLWDWISAQISTAALVMPNVAFEEVAHVIPECAEWLEEHGLQILDATSDCVAEAFRIKRLLGIHDDSYNPKGVGETDLLIIGAARANDGGVVTEEARQSSLPQDLTRMKIPAVCEMIAVGVACMSFVEYFKRSGEVFR